MGQATQEVLRSIFEEPRQQGSGAPSITDRFIDKFRQDALGRNPNYQALFGSSGGGSIPGLGNFGSSEGSVSGGGGSPVAEVPPGFTGGPSIIEFGRGGSGGGGSGGGGSYNAASLGRTASRAASPGIGSRARAPQGITPGGFMGGGSSRMSAPSGGGGGNMFLDGLADGSLTIDPDGHIVDYSGRPVGIIINGRPVALRR